MTKETWFAIGGSICGSGDQQEEKIQGIQKALTFEKVNRWKFGRFQKPINALSKDVLSQAIWFNRHHYLTVRELRRHACQLADYLSKWAYFYS